MIAIDIFCGCGGVTEGLRQTGFEVKAGIELDKKAASCYAENHPQTNLFNLDIRQVDPHEILNLLNGEELNLLAFCPPCQGFSSIRRLNRGFAVNDDRNDLILDVIRFIEVLNPHTIMLENVPALIGYESFVDFVRIIEGMAVPYFVDYAVVDLYNYGIPQHRKRLVLVASRLGQIKIAPEVDYRTTVRDFIGNLESVDKTDDATHRVVAKHTERVIEMISKIPKNGGSRKDLPEEYILECHKKPNIGFNDVYGRLRWDDASSTITGGCLNPSKGRFLHPEENRCISAREAALLQTFPLTYIFPDNLTKTTLSLIIGNALPPEFSRLQSENIMKHLNEHGIE